MKTKLLHYGGLLLVSVLWTGLSYSQTINTTISNVIICPGSVNVMVPVTVENLSDVASISLSLLFDDTQLTYTGYTANTIVTSAGGTLMINSPPGGNIIVVWFGLSALPAVPNGDTLFTFLFTVNGSSAINWDINAQGGCEYTSIEGLSLNATWTNGSITASLPNADFTSPPIVCAGSPASVSVDFTSGTAPYTIVYNDGVNPDVTITTSVDPYVFTENIFATTTWNLVSISTAICSNLNVNKTTTTAPSSGPVAFNVTGGGNVCQNGPGAMIGLDSTEAGISYELFLDNVTTSLIFTGTGSPLFFGEYSTPGTYTVKGTSECGTTEMIGNAIVTFTYSPVVTLTPFASVCDYVQLIALTGGLPSGGTYSGDGVSDGSFNPSLAGIGSHTITYTIAEGGCTGFASLAIIVNPQPIVILTPIGPLCSNTEPIDLEPSGSPIGGIFTGTGVIQGPGQNFDPNTTGPGTFPVTYQYTNEFGCSASETMDVIVSDPPLATISYPTTICAGGYAMISVNISGGEPPYQFTFFDGTTVDTITSDGYWNLVVSPSVTTNYYVQTVTSAYNCTAFPNLATTISVAPLPEIIFASIAPVCANTETFLLNAFPVGGTFSGPGVNGDYFNPASVGPGTYTITYTYADSCSNSGNIDIIVIPVPEITMNPSYVTVYEGNNASFSVAANIAATYQWQLSIDGGLSWTDLLNDVIYSGVNTDQLNISGVTTSMNGNLYHIVASGFCTPAAISAYAILNATPQIVTIAGTASSCTSNTILVPISVEYFNAVAALSLTLNYAADITFSGYQDVNPLIDEGFLFVNASGGQVKISYFNVVPLNIGDGLLLNLIFSSPGGSSDLTWDFGVPENCEFQNISFEVIPSQYIDGSVMINPTPEITIDNVGPLCLNTAPVTLAATPPGGTFSGDGVDAGIFSPEAAGIGTWTLTYTYSYGENCLATSTQEIVVNPEPTDFNITGGGPYCSDGTGVSISLDGSESGITYTLYLNGEATSSSITGTGSAISFDNVTAPGTYTISATSGTNCSAMMTGDASVSISEGLIVFAGNDVNIPAGSSTTLTVTVIGGTAPYTYLWVPSTNLNDPTLATVVANPSSTETYVVMVMDAANCMSVDEVTVNVYTPQNNLSGTITYPNALLSPLSNVTVTLTDLNGVEPDQITTTDGAGHYAFNDLPLTSYQLHATSTHIWGGGNSLDGLVMLRHFVGLQFLTGLKLEAGNVAGTSTINAHDALNTLRRFVGLLQDFTPIGDWVFDHPSVVIDGIANQVVDFNGLCTGDVNADYLISGAKTSPTIAINEEGTVYAVNGTIIIPVVAEEDMTIGSVSMIVTLPSQVEVKSVDLKGDNTNLVYNIIGNELRIGWFSLDPMIVFAGENLLTITLASNASLDGQTIQVDGNSVLSDNIANIIDMAKLRIPKISTAAPGLSLNSFPNPVNTSVTYTYSLPESGKVMIELFNTLGERIKVITNEFQDAGLHSINVDASELSQGIYLSRLTVNGATVNKLIIINH